MITEYRSIIFSNGELIKALRPLMEARGKGANTVPAHVQIQLDSENEDELEVVYKFGEDEPDEIFNSREVGAAVLNHCIERGIPLPRGCHKELAIRGHEMALVIRMDNRADDPQIEDDFE